MDTVYFEATPRVLMIATRDVEREVDRLLVVMRPENALDLVEAFRCASFVAAQVRTIRYLLNRMGPIEILGLPPLAPIVGPLLTCSEILCEVSAGLPGDRDDY